MLIRLTPSLARLIQELEKLPGVGPKTAQRLAFHLLRVPVEDAGALAASIIEVRQKIRACTRCFNFSEDDLCPICNDSTRDTGIICVVSDVRDLMAVENAGEYRGYYHVLQGLISPMDGVGPGDLRIEELIGRVLNGSIREIILALSPTVEGDATAHFVAGRLTATGARVTQLAMGLPAGGDLDYADQMTIIRALEGRRDMS